MTLVIYDIENIKTSDNSKTNKDSKKFDLLELREKIESKIEDNDFKHVLFMALTSEGTFRFKDFMMYHGFDVITKKGLKKKNKFNGVSYEYYDNDIDAKIVTYCMQYGCNYDNIVLVSGDGDMSNLVKYLLDCAYVTVCSWKDNLSYKLINIAHQYVYIEDLLKGESNE